MILVTGYVHIDPSHADAFLADIEGLSPASRAGSGCSFYSVTAADPEAGRMLVVELWQSQQSLTAHLRNPETLVFLEKWSGRMHGEVRKYDALNERSLLD